MIRSDKLRTCLLFCLKEPKLSKESKTEDTDLEQQVSVVASEVSS